ncbi:hypothetical protein ACLBWZ_03345 [Brucellaceae bacterium C25G]
MFFPVAWITDKILISGALAGLNDEALVILLVLIEIGARMGLIANLAASTICLMIRVRLRRCLLSGQCR